MALFAGNDNSLRKYVQGYKFSVSITGLTGATKIGFRSVDGLNETTEIIEYREGTDYPTPRKLSGLTNFDNVTLERGLATDTVNNALLSWKNSVYTSGEGNITESSSLTTTSSLTIYRDVYIDVYNKVSALTGRWTLLDAWPHQYTFSTLDAMSGDVLITSLVLAHSGMIYEHFHAGASPSVDL